MAYLDVRSEGIYIDATLGGGGHSGEILHRLGKGGRLICMDRDPKAIQIAGDKLRNMQSEAILDVVRGNFRDIAALCSEKGVTSADGIIFDLGVSSGQLDDEERGFSYNTDAPLDMRMDTEQELNAATVVNTYSADRLRKILYGYGEERWTARIVEFVVSARNLKPIRTTGELAGIIKAAIPAGARQDGPHPARRTFQAIRIEVNNELEIIGKALKDAIGMLAENGRICVIAFHSLEDRIVKNTFRELSGVCVCPPHMPACTCGRRKVIEILTKKPIQPGESETATNPRARSAKMRAARKIKT